MSTKELVDALLSGDAKNIQAEFDSIMSEKIMSRLDDMRQEVSQNLFAVNEDEDINRAILSGKKGPLISVALRGKNPKRPGIDDVADESDRQEANGIMKAMRDKNGGQPLGLDVRDEVENQIAGPGNFNLAPGYNTHAYTPFKTKAPRKMVGGAQFEGYSAEELRDFTHSEEFNELSSSTKEAFLEYLK